MNYDEINYDETMDLLERTTLALRGKIHDDVERFGHSDPKEVDLLDDSMTLIAKVNGFPDKSISHLMRKYYLKNTRRAKK